MNNLLSLVKINVLGMFKNKNVSSKKRNSGIILFTIAFLYLAFYIYMLSNMLLDGLIQINAPYLVLVMFMIFSSLFIILTTLFRVGSTIFNFKDYDLLLSLPIKKETVIISKILQLYVLSLLYTILFMVPTFISYVMKVDVSVIFCIVYFITLFIIPIVPLIISIIIGTIISAISSRFKHKNIISYILTFGILILAFSLQSTLNNINTIDFANISKSLIDKFNNIYPLTKLYINIIKDNNIVSLLLYILTPIFLSYVFIKVLNRYYIKLNNALSSHVKKNNYKLEKINGSSSLIALYKKELKRYFSSVMYVTNTAIGVIMLTIGVFGIVLFGGDKINELLGIPEFYDSIIKLGPLVISFLCLMSPTTHSSISLEGKNLWILKTIPVKEKDILLSKIMVNLTITIPAILINSTVFCIYFKTSLVMTLFMYITPFIASLFISMFGLVINLNFPKFDWKNEVTVVKQSLSAFVTLFVGMAIGFIPIVIPYSISSNLYIMIVTLIMLALTSMLYIYLNTRGITRFKNLNS